MGKPDPTRDSARVSQTAPPSKSLSTVVWEYLESEPGFVDAVREGERQIAGGQSVKFREVRRRR